jgi:hypothetical protein
VAEITIYFKRQAGGKWRRDDGESKVLVDEAVMNREIRQLLDNGWHMRTEGVTFRRGVTMIKNTLGLYVNRKS